MTYWGFVKSALLPTFVECGGFLCLLIWGCLWECWHPGVCLGGSEPSGLNCFFVMRFGRLKNNSHFKPSDFLGPIYIYISIVLPLLFIPPWAELLLAPSWARSVPCTADLCGVITSFKPIMSVTAKDSKASTAINRHSIYLPNRANVLRFLWILKNSQLTYIYIFLILNIEY